MRTRPVRLAVVFAVAALGSASAAPGLGDLRTYLDEVVLGSEFGPAPAGVRRWSGDVTWSLSGPDAAQWTAEVSWALEWIDLRAADVRFVRVPSGGAMEIWCGPQDSWSEARHVRERVAGYAMVSQDRGRIQRAWVLLARAGLPWARRVAREELFQAMGFLADASRPDWSITSRDTWNDTYTQLDAWWLMVLYGGPVPPGADAATAWNAMLRATSVAKK